MNEPGDDELLADLDQRLNHLIDLARDADDPHGVLLFEEVEHLNCHDAQVLVACAVLVIAFQETR